MTAQSQSSDSDPGTRDRRLPPYPTEYGDLDALQDALEHEIERVADDNIEHAETMADVRYSQLDDADAVEVHVVENETAEFLPPTSGSWGTRAVERWHDVVVTGIERVGRFHKRRNPDARPERDGHIVFVVPLADNRGDYFQTGGKL
jgi:hypothetical protein